MVVYQKLIARGEADTGGGLELIVLQWAMADTTR